MHIVLGYISSYNVYSAHKIRPTCLYNFRAHRLSSFTFTLKNQRMFSYILYNDYIICNFDVSKKVTKTKKYHFGLLWYIKHHYKHKSLNHRQMEIDINFRETNIIFQHKNSPQKLKKEPFFPDKKKENSFHSSRLNAPVVDANPRPNFGS